MVNLYVYPKTGESFTCALEHDRTSVGRALENDLSLPDQFCSSRHALIAATDVGYVIRDLGSKNGVFVNGKKIQLETELRKGDEVLLGSTRIIFDQEAATRIEMVEGPPGLGEYNTIIGVRDILKKPVVDTATRPKPQAADFEKLRREQKFLSVLNEVSQALIYHLPLDQLLDHIMDLISQNIPMDRGVLMLKEGDPAQLIPKVVRILNPDLKNVNIQVSRTILNTAMARNSSILLSDVQSDSQFKEQASVLRSNVRTAMCVPLWNNQEIIGIVYADRASPVNPFTEDDLKLLTLLANVTAVKIENAKLIEQALEKCRMEREMAVAAQIQRNLLPREAPRLEKFEVCGGNKGCFQIGGDYYDFIPLDSGRLGIAIADVSGCGVGPALLMASLRASLRAEVGPRHDLTGMAARLNDFVHQSSESHTYITFFFGELDTETGEMSFVNAGHNPPIVLDVKGGLQRLESTGFCLGMFPGVIYGAGSVRLGPGDLLCLYTDGITEGRSAGNEEYGEDRLQGFLRENMGLAVPKIMEKIFAEVRCHTGCAEPGDDMTLVLVKRVG
jgi:serine phosphatase RsbU (regulator of sigma subunit)/pSer/pThr/pTyr-binding forkhead associated (FHA) protein